MGDNGAGIRIAIVKGSVRSRNFTSKAVALVVDELHRLKVGGIDVIDPAELDLAFPGMPAGHSRQQKRHSVHFSTNTPTTTEFLPD